MSAATPHSTFHNRRALDTWLIVQQPPNGGWRTPFDYRPTTLAFLFFTVLVFFLLQIAVTIVLAVLDSYNMKMFTYWSFTILTAYYFSLLVALIVEHRAITAVVMFLTPITLGLTMFVFVAILVIVWDDARVLIEGTVCDTPAGDITMENNYAGDKLIHAIPVIGMLTILYAGLEFFSHRIFVLQVHRFSWLCKWLYFAFWMLIPVCIVSLFQIIFNVEKTYPTGLPTWARILIMGAIIELWQGYTLFRFNSVSSYRQVHARALPTRTDLTMLHNSAATARLDPNDDEL